MARILIIDDDAGVSGLLENLVLSLGHEVRTATNGKDGLESVRTDSIDLVITDMVMPEMDGLEVMRELRFIAPGLPIIATSGGSVRMPELYLKLAGRLGAGGVLPKPFSISHLQRLLDELLPRSS